MGITTKNLIKIENPTAIALGYFDGLHIGHMKLLKKIVKVAKENELKPIVIFLSHHPKRHLVQDAPERIIQIDLKVEVLEKMGISVYYVNFSDIMNLSSREFVEKVLVQTLNAKFVTCGQNYHFGKGGKGNAEKLEALCGENNIGFEVAKLLKLDDEVVSSTAIRKLIKNGEIKKANVMLGRPFMYEFEVVSGDQRGRTLGFPTINQFFQTFFLVPRFGVYCSRVYIDGKAYLGVTNIGIRPTVETKKMRSETYIDEFSGDLYGRKIRVCLLDFLRDEIKFNSLEELENQIKVDLATAKKAYAQENKEDKTTSNHIR